jgi:hypothetical protein
MKRIRVVFLAAISLTASAFLAYTLLNLEVLGIPITHPRVLVEAGIAVGAALLTVWEARR